MAGKGGKRDGAGRKKGVPNKSTQEIRDIIHGVVDFEIVAIKMLELVEGVTVKETDGKGGVNIYEKEPNVAAAKLLLEYGYGKPKEVIELDAGANTTEIVKIFAEMVSSASTGEAT